jgi:hypothetical protein
VTNESLAFRRRALEVAAHRGDERLVEVKGPASRRELLARAGIQVPDEALRAAAAAWSATESAERR